MARPLELRSPSDPLSKPRLALAVDNSSVGRRPDSHALAVASRPLVRARTAVSMRSRSIHPFLSRFRHQRLPRYSYGTGIRGRSGAYPVRLDGPRVRGGRLLRPTGGT